MPSIGWTPHDRTTARQPQSVGCGLADPEPFAAIRKVIEGKLHTGEAAVVQFCAEKPSLASLQAEQRQPQSQPLPAH